MTQEETIEIIKITIETGIINDFGQGSNFGIFNITEKDVKKKRMVQKL